MTGALITAQHAGEQGRPVYAVPGNINSQFSAGSNFLIRDGAIPLVVIDDLIRDIGIDPSVSIDQVPDIGPDELLVFRAVAKYDGVSVNTIASEIRKSPSFVSSVVTIMEIKGLVETYGGKIFLAK